MKANFKEQTSYKKKKLDIINENKELFAVILKGGIPESWWNKFINCAIAIRNIEI
jgi:hypothetical protein